MVDLGHIVTIEELKKELEILMDKFEQIWLLDYNIEIFTTGGDGPAPSSKISVVFHAEGDRILRRLCDLKRTKPMNPHLRLEVQVTTKLYH